uniref:Methyltransferase domain-containing protein n=1 Tax=Strigamia maritima TaxID=126957 RepID=T1J7F9_STRMM
MADIKKMYESDFNSHMYAKSYVTDEYENMWYVEEFYHRLFETKKLQGKTLIEVGCGPTLRAALVASRYGCEVVCADLLEKNRDFVQNWLKNGHAAFDFSAQFKHVAQLEGKDDIEYLEERVKASVKEVIFCDIMENNPLHPRPLEQFDIVTSSCCLDCNTEEKNYFKGAKSISSLVRPGGYLAIGSSLDATYYHVGDKTLPVQSVDGAIGKRAFTEAGLKVLEVCEYYLNNPIPGCDTKGFFTIYATKP